MGQFLVAERRALSLMHIVPKKNRIRRLSDNQSLGNAAAFSLNRPFLLGAKSRVLAAFLLIPHDY